MTIVSLDQLLENLPGSIWQKVAEIDGLKGQWIGGDNFRKSYQAFSPRITQIR